MKEIIVLFLTTVLQTASFTLVSRARNSQSIIYNAGASVVSNTVWVIVMKQIIAHLDSVTLMGTYIVASVFGSVSMHWVAMRFFERKKA